VGIRTARASELDPIASLLDRSFAEDPFVAWVTGGRRGARRRYVDLVLKHLTFPHGAVDVDEALRGASLWAPPGAWELGVREQLKMLPHVLRVVGWRRLGKVARASEAIERGRPPRYYYLALVATAPEARGRGVGKQLLLHGLERADGEGVPAVLETSVESNVGWYERLGFEVVRELSLPDGPNVWTMRRPPP